MGPHRLFEILNSTDICTPPFYFHPPPRHTHTYTHRAKSALEVKSVVFRKYKIAIKLLSLDHFISDIISLRLAREFIRLPLDIYLKFNVYCHEFKLIG